MLFMVQSRNDSKIHKVYDVRGNPGYITQFLIFDEQFNSFSYESSDDFLPLEESYSNKEKDRDVKTKRLLELGKFVDKEFKDFDKWCVENPDDFYDLEKYKVRVIDSFANILTKYRRLTEEYYKITNTE